jgi:hypothetical protein
MNHRFSEYATSGAFSLSLTRNQVSSLALLEGGAHGWASNAIAALERKGLAETIPSPQDYDAEAVQYRATLPGLLVTALCREAGLTNGAPDPVSAELDALKAEVASLRLELREAKLDARSAMARKAKATEELENARRFAARDKFTVSILPRDPQPGLTDAELHERIGADA